MSDPVSAEKTAVPGDFPDTQPSGGRTLRAVLMGLAVALNFAVVFLTSRGQSSHVLTLAWILSVVYFLVATRDRRRAASSAAPLRKRLLVAAVVLLPTLVRIANMDEDRVHGDELMTGYFSATHDFRNSSFFAPMPERHDWVSQFPKPFFALQRAFFEIAGTSRAAVRFSILPYVLVVSWMLYLTVREMLDESTALVAVVLYAFLPISVYLEVSGFHFISSTAAFMAFFYFALRAFRTGSLGASAAAGVLAGLCYLSYPSSYIALPALLGIAAVDLVRRRRLFVLRNLTIALLGCWIAASPFLAGPRDAGGFLAQRASQVSLLTGEWSGHRDAIARGADPIPIVRENLKVSVKSLHRDGIGGHGGYDFGRLALFDLFSLGLFLAGSAAALILAVKRIEILFVLAVIVASFFGGVVMTLPPPAYHRFSLAFPFLAIVMALPYYLLFRAPVLSSNARLATAIGTLFLFACVSQDRLARALIADVPSDELRLARFLDQRFPGRVLYYAAFPSYAAGKMYLFLRSPGPERPVRTDYHSNLLDAFDRREKYVYAITLPPAFNEKFTAADPAGRLFHFSNRYSVFAN